MVQPFATTTSSTTASGTSRGPPGTKSSSRPPKRRLTAVDSGSGFGIDSGRIGDRAVRGGGTDEGVGEVEMEKRDEVGAEEKEEEGEDGGDGATRTIGKIHNAKYISGLIDTLESVLDKWIVSGAMATVSGNTRMSSHFSCRACPFIHFISAEIGLIVPSFN
jgi:hypothetical protein